MTYRTEPITMWFDRRLVMHASPIQGIGTFATEAIGAGELLIWVTGGIVYTPEDWKAGKVQLEGELYNEERLGDNLLIATPKVFHYYVNHSCDANALDTSRTGNVTNYIAWRDIDAGQEVTTDYGLYGTVYMEKCGCGSETCRGKVTPEDWQLEALQKRFRNFIPRHIEEQQSALQKIENE